MAVEKVLQIDGAELRRLAEERLRENIGTAPPLGKVEEPLRLLHELQVHQIELEMQNEELRQARAEREKMEARLGKYSELYDFAPVGYFNLDHGGIIRAVNLTGAGFHGIACSLLIGRRLDYFISDESRPVFRDLLDKVFASETKETCEVVLQKERHSPLVVQIEAVLSESREECRAVFIDITERKRLLDQLQLTQFCVDKAAIGIFRISEEGNIRFANELACLSLGHTPEELCSMMVFEIDPTLKVERFQDHRKTVRAKGLGTFETVHRRKDGSTFPVEITVNYHEYQGEGFTVSSARDITERKMAEEQIRQKKMQLEELNRTLRQKVKAEVAKNREKDIMLIQQNRMAALGEMFDHIAHQWQQPLNSIAVIVQALGSTCAYEQVTTKEVLETVDKIMDMVGHMAQTVDVFRNFYKPDKEKTVFLVKDSIEKALSFVKPALRRYGIDVDLDYVGILKKTHLTDNIPVKAA
jgi:PAS domain S-box-containing protein